FTCNRSPEGPLLLRAINDVTTTNLRKHFNKCILDRHPNANSDIRSALSCTYTRATFRILSTEWIVESGQPFSILQDRKLQDIMHKLYNRFNIHGRTTVSSDVKQYYALSKEIVIKELQVCSLFILGTY
ncbi:hypothetical protein BT69DRAFT_1210420, partial [Atractiella rhizophila]